MVEAAGVEIYRDANNIERLLHIQELGVPGDPTVSAVIWWPRAERGQSDREWVGTRSPTLLRPPRRVSRAMRCTVERGRLDLMTAAVKAVLEQAKRLSPEELAELRAELDALEDPAWAAAWKNELDRRWAAYESGEAGEPAEDVIAEIRTELRAARP